MKFNFGFWPEIYCFFLFCNKAVCVFPTFRSSMNKLKTFDKSENQEEVEQIKSSTTNYLLSKGCPTY